MWQVIFSFSFRTMSSSMTRVTCLAASPVLCESIVPGGPHQCPFDGTPVPHHLASRIPDAATLSSATLARLDAGTKRAFASLPTAPEIRRLTVNPAIRAVALSLLRRVASASASASPRVAASVAARACSFATVLRRRSSLHRCSAKSALAFWSSSSSPSDCAAACAWQSPNTVVTTLSREMVGNRKGNRMAPALPARA